MTGARKERMAAFPFGIVIFGRFVNAGIPGQMKNWNGNSNRQKIR
jgi:hypothetical protein